MNPPQRRLVRAFAIALLAAWLQSNAQAAVIHIVADPELVVTPNGDIALPLDLDRDGVVDFEFLNDGRDADVRTLGTNRILADMTNETRVYAVSAGAIVGAELDPGTTWTASFFLDPPVQ